MKRSSAVRSQGAHGAHGGGPASAVVLIRRALLDAAAAIAVMTVLAACVKHVPADFTTANELPDDDRKPYGIAVDRTSEPPLARHHVASSHDVATLRTPLGTDAAQHTLESFFAAVIAEDLAEVAALLAPAAPLHHTGKANSPASSATLVWRQRFRKYDYRQLAGRPLYRSADVAVFRARDLERLPTNIRALNESSAWWDALDASSLVLRVTILSPTLKSERLWGSEVYFWLRRVDDRFIIERLAEDVPL